MNKLGLTLAEVIVAALILAITVAGVLFMLTSENIAVFRTGHNVQAIDFARQTLDELRNAVREDTWDTGFLSPGPHSTEPFLSLSGTELGDNFNATRRYDVQSGPALGSYREGTVTIEWTEPDLP